MIIDGKIYRNLPEQVEKNKNDIAKLQEGFTQSGYTKAEADAKFADKLDTENSIAEIQTYINSDKKAMSQLQRTVEKNTTDIAAQDSKINAATEAAENASGVAQNAYTAATEAKAAVDGNTSQMNELTASVSSLEASTSALGTDLQNTKNRVTAVEGNVTSLSTTVDNINKVVPTDIAVINGKLGLEHDGKWLTGQNAIRLGSNLSYNADTNTLDAIGGSTDNYYTKVESDAKYAAKTSVYTKDESNSKFETISDANKEHTALSTRISTNATDIANAESNIADLTSTAQSLEQNKQDKLTAGDNITIDASNRISAVDIYTKAESDEKYQPKGTYVIPSDLDIYEKKSDLNTTLEGYVTTASLGTTLEDYALKTEIPKDFYTKSQSDGKYQLKGNYVTTDGLTVTLDDYALKTEIPTDFYTKAQSDEKYALKTAIPTDFYTREQSDEKYAWKIDVDDRFYTKIQSDARYVTQITITTKYYDRSQSDTRYQLKGKYVTEDSLTSTLSDYALKTDIPTDFYTRAQSDGKYQLKGDYVTTAGLTTTLDNYVLKTEIPTDTDFYTKSQSDEKYALKTEIPTDFYTKAESDEKYQHKGTYVVPADLDVYEKKSDLNTTLESYVTNTSLETTLSDYALKTEIPTDFYTKAQSDGKYQVKGDYVVNATLSNYSTTEQMNAAINTAITGAIEGAY